VKRTLNDLEQLKRQAKERAAESNIPLHQAQFELARSFGFASWPKLKAYVDGITIRRLADAIVASDIEEVKRMLRARPELADMQMSYGDERRPIHFAVMHRSTEITRLLMSHGANPCAGVHPHRDATSALTMAREREYPELVAILDTPKDEPVEERVEPELPDPARIAAANGDVEWLKARHAEGKLINPIRWSDGGLLTVAVQNDLADVLNLLLDFGFDPNERISAGEGDWIAYSQGFPLYDCAAHDRRELAEILLKRGADPNVHVDSGGSSVHSAFSHRNWEMVEILRRYGGVVTADTAAIYRRADIARELVNEHAEELLNFGADGGAVEVVRMALEKIDWPPDDLRWYRSLTNPLSFWHHIPWLYAGVREFDREGYLECFRLILPRTTPNLVAGFGRTALHEVSAMGNWVTDEEAGAFARMLLEAGAKTNLRDDLLNSTPLGWACRWGRPTVVQALLDHSADPIEADAEPWARPRAWASKKGHNDVLAILLR